VPQFYLRYFATESSRRTDQPQVWIFSKDDAGGDEKLTHVRNVCGKRYLYSPMQPDGDRNWDLDAKLDDIESILGGLWPKLANGMVPLDDGPIRKGLALFVAIMHLRNPEVRKGVEHIHSLLVKLYESAPKLPDTTPAIDAIEINGEVHKVKFEGWHNYREWSKDDHDRFFAHIIQSEAIHIAKILLHKRWSIVLADADTFITSDRPVSIHHADRQVVGFDTAGGVICFPLSPTRLLIMDDLHNEPANQCYPLQKSNIGGFNNLIWRGGSRFMITGRSVPEVLTELLAFEELVVGADK